MIYLRASRFLFVLRSLLALMIVAEVQHLPPQAHSEARRTSGGQRLRPPESVKCPRDRLTSFTGQILSYSRSTGRTTLRLRTDEATTESFTLRHPKSDDPTTWFLLRGESFTSHDWALIETSKGHLRPKMRATVWVCSDGTNPMVDWQPPEEKAKGGTAGRLLIQSALPADLIFSFCLLPFAFLLICLLGKCCTAHSCARLAQW